MPGKAGKPAVPVHKWPSISERHGVNRGASSIECDRECRSLARSITMLALVTIAFVATPSIARMNDFGAYLATPGRILPTFSSQVSGMRWTSNLSAVFLNATSRQVMSIQASTLIPISLAQVAGALMGLQTLAAVILVGKVHARA